jgi:hypothetical protein
VSKSNKVYYQCEFYLSGSCSLAKNPDYLAKNGIKAPALPPNCTGRIEWLKGGVKAPYCGHRERAKAMGIQ